MPLYIAAGRLLASYVDVLRGSSRVFFPTNGKKCVGKETRDEPLRTSAWEARRLLASHADPRDEPLTRSAWEARRLQEVCDHGYECLTDPRLYKARFQEL